MQTPVIRRSLWVCRRKLDFSSHQWPDGTVLFDDASGEFHCLAPVAGELMTLMLKMGSCTAQELAAQLLEEAPSQVDVEMVENMLTNLKYLSLIDHLSD